jgi:hypothetical protein
MPRLIKTNLTSAGKPELRDRTPSGLPHLRTPHAFAAECQYVGPQVVTHEIEFVPIIFFGGVDRHFCGRQSENQPSVARVYKRKSENVPQEGAISRRILAVHDYMRTKDHELLSFGLRLSRHPDGSASQYPKITES